MIQPLKNTTSIWSLCWVDLSEPLPVEEDFYLPTILLLVGPSFEPLVPPAIFHELDQVEAEEWVAHHFDDLGVPDQLLVWKAPEWVLEEWKYFGRDWKTKVKLVNPPPRTKPGCSPSWPACEETIPAYPPCRSRRWPKGWSVM